VERSLAVIAFRSEPAVAETPGVLSRMVDALYRRGINCLETVSVHTDSLFVFRDRDVIRAYQALSELLGPEARDASAPPKTSRGQHR
ncbi:MAG TPA: ACT domain-containing protein, partial [Thermoplasmata archaeon]|nr:ACT domain-containing protein [Thermoplasmata archaeon]